MICDGCFGKPPAEHKCGTPADGKLSPIVVNGRLVIGKCDCRTCVLKHPAEEWD